MFYGKRLILTFPSQFICVLAASSRTAIFYISWFVGYFICARRLRYMIGSILAGSCGKNEEFDR